MRTSLIEIKQLEKYLENKMDIPDALLQEARLLSNPLWQLNFFLQKKVYSIVQLYHRKKLKEEADAAYLHLLNDPMKTNFQQNLNELFKEI